MSEANPGVLPGAEPFETNKTLSIIAIVVGVVTCGCLTLLFGILGLVFANKAQTLWNAGDVTGANSAASSARIFAIIGFVLAVLWLVFALIGGAAGFISVPFSN
ncbi:MAG: CD225/dispanin family protein [Candidatus Nanopelagicales bacterium]